MLLFPSHPITQFPIGNIRLADHHAAVLGNSGQAHPNAWIDKDEFGSLSDTGPTTLLDSDGNALAWLGDEPRKEQSIIAEISFLIIHEWDLLRANESYLQSIEEDCIEGEVSPLASIDGHLWIGPGTRMLPGVVIERNVVIGANCKIGPNCYIRDNTSIGDNCIIGNAVEIKNSIILSNTNVGHLSYLGDSILGERVNLGAGTIVSNFRHDEESHRTMIDGELVDTGLLKFGTIIGDDVRTGINTSIYPGRKLHSGARTRPGEIVQRDLS